MLTFVVSAVLLACSTDGKPSDLTCSTTSDCDTLQSCYSTAYAAIDSCTDDADCGLSDDGETLAVSGEICDGSGVVRLDADLTEVNELLERAASCEWAKLGSPAVCDSYEGFVCDDGRCDASWLNQ